MSRKCPHCSEINEDTLELCSNCSAPLAEDDIVKKKEKKLKAIVTGVLSVSPKTIEMTELKRSEVKDTYLLLARSDFESDKFTGTITPPNIPGFKLKADTFEGVRNVVNIQIEAKQLNVGENYEGYIEIKSQIGEARIPVRLGISADSPQLDLDQDQIQINMNKKEKSTSFCVTNIGYGTLMGTVKSKTPWLSIEDSSFSLGKDGKAEIEVAIDKKELRKVDRGGRMSLEGMLRLETNAGDEDIKVLLYLPPRLVIGDFKQYLPLAIGAAVVIILLIFTYPYIKKFLTPKEARKTGIWGQLAGESGSQSMVELKWNPFSEPEKIVFIAINGKDGHVGEIKFDNNSSHNTLVSSQTDRLYTPSYSPDGFLVAFGLPVSNAVNEKGKAKFVNMAIANENKKQPDVLTEYSVKDKIMNIATDPAWSPDGLKLAFVKTSSPDAFHGEILLIDYDNADSYSISNLPNQNINILGKNPRWSPDGTKIVIEDLNKELYIIEPAGRKNQPVVTKLTKKEDFTAFEPKWLPDGNNVVFSRDTGKDGKDKGEICIISSGKELKSVIQRPTFEDLNPDCSSDGKLITFDSKEYGAEKKGDIYIVGISGKDLKNITNTPAVDEKNPVWSPDGKKIAYLAYDGTNWQLYLIKPGEKELKSIQLTDEDFNHGIPVWWSPESYNKRLQLIKATEKDKKEKK